MAFPSGKKDGKTPLAVLLSVNMDKEGMLWGFGAPLRPGSQPGSEETRDFRVTGCAFDILL